MPLNKSAVRKYIMENLNTIHVRKGDKSINLASLADPDRSTEIERLIEGSVSTGKLPAKTLLD